MAKNDFKLTQTKSQFKIVGVVTGLSNENAYREDVISKGKNEGKEYRSIRFGVKTSDVNTVYVEMFGMEMEYVYAYKQSDVRGQKGDTKKVAFAQRNNLPKGYNILSTSIGLDMDASGKPVRHGMAEYDAVEKIHEEVQDGDSVYVSGEIDFSEYETKQGEKRKQVRYIIKSISKQTKPVEFDSEKFKESAGFEQELVFVNSEYDKETKKVHVLAYVIKYGDKFETADFVINVDEDNKANKKVAEVFSKKMKFGDFCKVMGKIVNKVETIEVESEEEDIWGEVPEEMKKTAIKNRVTELVITAADGQTYEKAKYSDEDFVVEEFIKEEKPSKKADNPFDSDEDDDDLPF